MVLTRDHKRKAFRLYPSNIEALKKIVEKVSAVSETKAINETDVIKGLISLGSKTKPETLLKEIKKVFVE